jgi:hypothetical protein
MFRTWSLVIAGFLLFTVIFFTYYPPTYAIVDESSYLSTAYALQRGTFYYDEAGINQEHVSQRVGTHQVSRYPPGNPLLLLPFTIIVWRLAFVRGWLLAGLGLGLIILILRHYRLPEPFALLFLLHPTVLLYSRTVMSDLPAAIAILFGVYLCLKKKPLASGMVLGLSAAIRYPNLIVPAVLFILALIRKENRNAGSLLAGVIVGVCPLLIYNRIIFGTFWGSAIGYGVTFSLNSLPRTLLAFILSLITVYPLMLIGAFFWKNRDRWFFLAPAMVTMLFYGFQGYFDQPVNLLAGLVMNLRYLLPVIPLFLIPYIGFLNRGRWPPRLLSPAIGLLLILSVILSRQHQRFLDRNVEHQRELYRNTPDAGIVICNKDVYELINPYVRYVPWFPFEVMRRPQSLETFLDRDRVYLACLTGDADIRRLFDAARARFRAQEEVYTAYDPKYFSIWRVGNPRLILPNEPGSPVRYPAAPRPPGR